MNFVDHIRQAAAYVHIGPNGGVIEVADVNGEVWSRGFPPGKYSPNYTSPIPLAEVSEFHVQGGVVVVPNSVMSAFTAGKMTTQSAANPDWQPSLIQQQERMMRKMVDDAVSARLKRNERKRRRIEERRRRAEVQDVIDDDDTIELESEVSTDETQDETEKGVQSSKPPRPGKGKARKKGEAPQQPPVAPVSDEEVSSDET
jgi:hypothetical protein